MNWNDPFNARRNLRERQQRWLAWNGRRHRTVLPDGQVSRSMPAFELRVTVADGNRARLFFTAAAIKHFPVFASQDGVDTFDGLDLAISKLL
jgi:hypothetical protein